MATLCRDLPDLIPMPLVIGTKVTARLRQPQDGLFVGQIDAVDTSNNTYRITFDRQGLGTHSVPDYEVLVRSGKNCFVPSSFPLFGIVCIFYLYPSWLSFGFYLVTVSKYQLAEKFLSIYIPHFFFSFGLYRAFLRLDSLLIFNLTTLSCEMKR